MIFGRVTLQALPQADVGYDEASCYSVQYRSFGIIGRRFSSAIPATSKPEVQTVIDKMLGCGDPASGYITSLCEHCLEEKLGIALLGYTQRHLRLPKGVTGRPLSSTI